MKYLFLLFFVPLVLAGQSETPLDHFADWHTDYNKAIADSKENKKNLLVYFTGSDWCAPCKMLKKDLFSKEEFKDISKSYSLLYIDIPRNKDLLTAEQMTHNREVLAKLNKKGVFPLFKVVNPKEKELDEYSGYSMNGEVAYHLEFLRKNR